MNKKELAAKIWKSANEMRSKIEANEYKDYILGFIFYKFLSEKEEEKLLQEGYEKDDIKKYVHEGEDPDVSGMETLQRELGYFIDYDNLFSTWIKKGSDFSVDDVIQALNAFQRLIDDNSKNLFGGIFDTLQSGISKLGENAKKQTSAVSKLIALIDEIPMDEQDYDVLGYIYEFLIGQFAANAGKKAGEFYTPHEVSMLMAQIVANHLKDRSQIKIYDPTSGSGSLLLNIGRACSKYISDPNRIKYYAQELKKNTYDLTRMNLVMKGILPANIVVRNGDTLADDWPFFENEDASDYELLSVDAVVSNPPYSQKWDPTDKENDPRYSNYGVAPQSRADYAFLLHDLYHLKPDGIMTIVLPHGVLFRSGDEGKIRKQLIENNNIDAIIGLPANIFFGTGIPTIVMVLKKTRSMDDVLIIDASKGYTKEGKNNKLRQCDICKIVDTITARKDVEKYARVVSKEEIRNNDYNLNIPRYVDSTEEADTYDIYATMLGGVPSSEVERLHKYWEVFPTLKDALFEEQDGKLVVKTSDIKKTIQDNESVKKYLNEYHNRFCNLGSVLNDILIENINSFNVAQTEDVLKEDLFKRYEGEKLVDAYDAYEVLSLNYAEISSDIEVMQSEGKYDAARQVDPNYDTKKGKNDKKGEVQDGWKGHILPFELVQKFCFAKKLEEIESLKNKLQSIPDELNTLLEDLSEDDKSIISDALTEENDAFNFKGIKNVIKELKADDSAGNRSLIEVLTKAQTLNDDFKHLKKDIKEAEEQLQLETKDKIMHLTDDEIDSLLYEKWITPICNSITELSHTAIHDFTGKVEALCKKYSETLRDIDEQIRQTEAELCSMLDELTGNERDLEGLNELRILLGGSHE